MKPETMTKSVWERRRLAFDVTLALATGDSVISVSGVLITKNSDDTDQTTEMLHSVPTLEGNVVYAVVTGGEAELTYTVKVRVITTNGDYIEDSIQLSVILEE